MTEHNTRSKTATDRLEEAVLRLAENQNHLTENQAALSDKVDSILNHLQTLTIIPNPPTPPTPPPSPTPPPHPPPPPPPNNRPHMKLEVPRFSGEDPMGWIFKISQFFDYQGTPDEERITVASFYMDGPALSWF